jgi:hypothetical protein
MFSITCGVAPTRSIPVSPAFEQARAFTEGVGFRQQVTAAPEQVFTLRRELDAATDAVEQWYAQFGFQRMNLPGKRRLAQIHAIGTAGETAGVGNADKGAQMTKVHAGHDNNFCIDRETTNALDTSAMRPLSIFAD